MGIDLFCKGCRLDPSHCVCGFTEEDFKTDAELFEATKFTQKELDFIDDMTQAIFDQANADEHRPYVITALCGSILSNLVRGSEGMLEVETVLKFTELATTSQLDHECCDGECHHDDCCGKVEANCPLRKDS